MAALLFWVLAAVAVAGALGVVLPLRRSVHAALSLGIFALALSGLFLLLGAELLGALQVLVNVGAVVSILALAILLLDPRRGPPGARQPLLRAVGAVLVAGFALQGIGLLSLLRGPWGEAAVGSGSTRALALLLASEHVLALQVAGLLLLAAILAGSVLVRRSSAS